MVKGLSKFKEYFKDYSGQYVLIGGTACSILLGKQDIEFRVTKDLDVVLIIELLDDAFVNQFITFINAGGYQHINKSTGNHQFYRFQSPTDADFPVMIELFSKKPTYIHSLDSILSPIYISDEVESLSAILLDDAYYNYLKANAIVIDGVSILNMACLILFKMKAWLDLSKLKKQGEKIDSKKIRKHLNDVIRLSVYLEPKTKLEIHNTVKEEAKLFIDYLDGSNINMKSLGFGNVSKDAIVLRLKQCFGIS